MRKLLASFAILAMLLTSCSSSKKAGTSKDVNPTNVAGDSFKTAIPINETDETKGVAAEYDWLRKYYPGYTFYSQSLVFTKDGHPYDVLNIKTAEGKKKDVYFDIIKFFGKF